MNRFNHKHCHVFYCKQQPCHKILTVIHCKVKQILGIMASNVSMDSTLCPQPRQPEWWPTCPARVPIWTCSPSPYSPCATITPTTRGLTTSSWIWTLAGRSQGGWHWHVACLVQTILTCYIKRYIVDPKNLH